MDFDPKSRPHPPLASPRGARVRVGVLDPRRVRVFAFATITLSLFGAAALSILSVWDYVHRDVGWRAIATFGIVIATMAAFTIVNEFFGAALRPPADAAPTA